MLLSLITGVALLSAAAIAGAHWISLRRYRQEASHRHNRGICVFLHESNVMNLYLQGDYEALTQEVMETTRTNREDRLDAQVHGIGARTGREDAKEKVKRYIKEVGPITALARLINAFEKADDIVYVNLFTQTLQPGKGLDRALRSTYGTSSVRRRSARLRELAPFVFVSVTGQFRATDKTDTTTTFSAPYGDPDDPANEPRHVSVTCQNSQFLEAIPEGPFSGRCIGRVQSWDPADQKLVIAPVLALFH